MVFRSERVLITGASGFTGRALAERLRQGGSEVVGLSHEEGEASSFKIDLLDLKGLTEALAQAKPTAIVHLAGVAAPTHGDISGVYSANVVGTVNLFAAMVGANIEPVITIVASSGQVYSVGDEGAPLTEDSLVMPKTHYAVSKRAAEDVARIYSERFPVIITRPFNYTGPGQSSAFLVPKIVQHFVQRKGRIHLGNLDLFRDFSDVDRAVEAYARLVQQNVGPNTVNICSGRAIQLASIVQTMVRISGYSPQIIIDPSLYRANEPLAIVGSPARLETLVGELPNPEFEETLYRMYHGAKRSHLM